ncbi:unnamed protein product, partial [Mycobacterium sp. PO1]
MHTSAWAPGTRPLTNIATDRTEPPQQQVATNYADQPLDSTYSQL